MKKRGNDDDDESKKQKPSTSKAATKSKESKQSNQQASTSGGSNLFGAAASRNTATNATSLSTSVGGSRLATEQVSSSVISQRSFAPTTATTAAAITGNPGSTPEAASESAVVSRVAIGSLQQQQVFSKTFESSSSSQNAIENGSSITTTTSTTATASATNQTFIGQQTRQLIASRASGLRSTGANEPSSSIARQINSRFGSVSQQLVTSNQQVITSISNGNSTEAFGSNIERLVTSGQRASVLQELNSTSENITSQSGTRSRTIQQVQTIQSSASRQQQQQQQQQTSSATSSSIASQRVTGSEGGDYEQLVRSLERSTSPLRSVWDSSVVSTSSRGSEDQAPLPIESWHSLSSSQRIDPEADPKPKRRKKSFIGSLKRAVSGGKLSSAPESAQVSPTNTITKQQKQQQQQPSTSKRARSPTVNPWSVGGGQFASGDSSISPESGTIWDPSIASATRGLSPARSIGRPESSGPSPLSKSKSTLDSSSIANLKGRVTHSVITPELRRNASFNRAPLANAEETEFPFAKGSGSIVRGDSKSSQGRATRSPGSTLGRPKSVEGSYLSKEAAITTARQESTSSSQQQFKELRRSGDFSNYPQEDVDQNSIGRGQADSAQLYSTVSVGALQKQQQQQQQFATSQQATSPQSFRSATKSQNLTPQSQIARSSRQNIISQAIRKTDYGTLSQIQGGEYNKNDIMTSVGQTTTTTAAAAADPVPTPAVRQKLSGSQVTLEQPLTGTSTIGGSLEAFQPGKIPAKSAPLSSRPDPSSVAGGLPAGGNTSSVALVGGGNLASNAGYQANAFDPEDAPKSELISAKGLGFMGAAAAAVGLKRAASNNNNDYDQPIETSGGTPMMRLKGEPDDADLLRKKPHERRKRDLVDQDGGLQDTQDVDIDQPPTRPYPKKVFFIIGNEFCERFSFYGLRTILILYLKNVLLFSDSTSTVVFHLFTTLCYLTPILGAILGDSILGKYNTILYLSIVYFIGELCLVVSSVLWYQGLVAIIYFFAGLFMIGIGTGGIKPCVSALGGDQFLTNEQSWRQGFFSIFYGAINLGSLISMFSVPMLRSKFQCVTREDCYPLAFGIPCLLMLIGIIVFVVAKSKYTIVPVPEKNVIVAFCQCCWLAGKRKLTGVDHQETRRIIEGSDIRTSKFSGPPENRSSQSTLSMSSDEINQTDQLQNGSHINDLFANQQVSLKNQQQASKSSTPIPYGDDLTENRNHRRTSLSNSKILEGEQQHWLYLARDRFDLNSIEQFRSVLAILLIFLPLPVYWCLFDQQGSLWTLQAARMNGDLFGVFTLEPDQMSVANPLLLLLSIPIFQVFIYPALGRCNLLTKPLQRMTAGGCLAALAFVGSSLIEYRIQQFLPLVTPKAGKANLILVNGLGDCSIIDPMILNIQSSNKTNMTLLESGPNYTMTKAILRAINGTEIPLKVMPLHAEPVEVSSSNNNQISEYKIKFRLADQMGQMDEIVGGSGEVAGFNQTIKPISKCPFNPGVDYELSVGGLPEKAVRFLYLEHGNGKLNYKMFNESLALPPIGKARVRLIYESFGSSNEASKRQFYLTRMKASLNDIPNSKNNSAATTTQITSTKIIKFNPLVSDGQLFASDYLDLDVAANGEFFNLTSNDSSMKMIYSGDMHKIFIEPGTRNLIIAQQLNGTTTQVKFQLLQDNKYKISMLYQLIPYTLISISEVMFSITGLEFSYSMAPITMKSVILSAWNLTTAFGNILTVAVESMQLFSSVAHDFLFYAFLMLLDMIIFALIGYFYLPYKASGSNQRTSTSSTSTQGNSQQPSSPTLSRTSSTSPSSSTRRQYAAIKAA